MSAETGLNWNWTKQPPKVLWKVPLGNGFSSLTVVGERLFTMCQTGHADIVVLPEHPRTARNFGLTMPLLLTLTCKGRERDRVPRRRITPAKSIACSRRARRMCLTAEGKLALGKEHFLKDSGAPPPKNQFFYWGVSASPFVERDVVIVQPGGDKDNSVVAYHKDNGEIVWSTGSDPHRAMRLPS